MDPLVFGIALPALLAGACWGVCWRLWDRRGGALAGGEWSGPLALALACAAGSLGLRVWSGFPPKVAEGWLLFIALAGCGTGLLESLRSARRPVQIASWFLLSVFTVWSVLGPRRAVWSFGESAVWHLSLAAGALALHASVERLASRRPGASMPLVLWLWSAGLAGALALTGCLLYGKLAGLAAAALGAAVVFSWWKPILSLAHGSAAVLVPWNVALLVCGNFYSDLPASAAVLLAAAPFALWIGEAGFVTRLRPWVGTLVRVLLIALPVAAALLVAAWPMLFPAVRPSGAPSGPEYKY